MESNLPHKVVRPVETIDLEQFYPAPDQLQRIDLKDFLFKGLILKEQEFRAQIEATDWSVYTGKYVGIVCSAQAIVPMWAYMIISSRLAPYALDVAVSEPAHLEEIFMMHRIAALDIEPFRGKRVVIKGCGDKPILEGAYAMISFRLAPVARSVMYGEPCSTVPVSRQ